MRATITPIIDQFSLRASECKVISGSLDLKGLGYQGGSSLQSDPKAAKRHTEPS